ncbi:tRNA 2-selenouridine(34) synthase MnmH [Bordetella genomosp. 9]|uniref:tRNA 2-selenouridine(34) synthase MnmH n=1 Tax=Bordetella genomosp. 9 TaxID=1416803 RepID=UPI000A28D90C|nr:tRNA 2-selenouridine(34) synthase MnmH [Bordetella genomosp. 9]ARP92077.1 tRNA 2-selenouridine(34) synthase MnmH [Bordetella genomosp. 9]
MSTALHTAGVRPDAESYRELFLSGVPLLDVRAPVEFARGAFPTAVNLPLMDDREREQVGLRYKEEGQQAAIALGTRLVSGAIKQQRVEAWAAFARAHPEGYLYCFRGGLRSQITQQWLREEAGIAYPRVIGGYKAMRTYLAEVIRVSALTPGHLVLGGLTGSGKTEVLHAVDNGVDLEGHANHRGSGFGKRVTPQPSQIDFEHRLAIDLLRKQAQGWNTVVLEDESRLIGANALPLELQQTIRNAPLVWLEAGLDERIERILDDYVVGLRAEFAAAHGDAGDALFAQRLQDSLTAISRKLGGERYARLMSLMRGALSRQLDHGECDGHRAWIRALLEEYYDPMYARHMAEKSARMVFRGDRPAVTEYLCERARQSLGQ